jgi:hypothetical protein
MIISESTSFRVEVGWATFFARCFLGAGLTGLVVVGASFCAALEGVFEILLGGGLLGDLGDASEPEPSLFGRCLRDARGALMSTGSPEMGSPRTMPGLQGGIGESAGKRWHCGRWVKGRGVGAEVEWLCNDLVKSY